MGKHKDENKVHGKSHKHKKHKKQKKKLTASSNSEEEVEWVEASSSKPKIKRDEWMTRKSSSSGDETPNPERKTEILSTRDEDEWIPTVSREDLMCGSSRQKKKDGEMLRKQQEDEIWKQRELNPHWKNNGSGLPETEAKPENLRLPSTSVGDGGLSLLLKARNRILEQAAKEGRSRDEIAAERYGSYDKLLSMIAEAEARKKSNLYSQYSDEGRDRGKDRSCYKRPEHNRSPSPSSERSYRFQKPKDYDRNKRHSNKFSSSRDRKRYSSYSKEYNNDHTETKLRRTPMEEDGDRKDKYSSYKRRSQSSEEDDKNDKLSTDKKSSFLEDKHQTDEHRSWKKRPDPDSDGSSKKDKYPAWKKRSISPSENKDYCKNEEYFTSKRSNDEESKHKLKRPTWRKPSPPRVSNRPSWHKAELEESEEKQQGSVCEERKSPEKQIIASPKQEDEAPPDKVSDSEEDLNVLEAAALRRRLLGVSSPKDETKPKSEKKEHDRVMLTKVDSSGQMRPIVNSGEEQGFKAQSNRKSRNKFFDDGSSYSLKNMFEREKLTTASDNLEMFMDVAARCDDRFDDNETSTIPKKAMSKMGNRMQEDKDYGKAIHQHQKQASALEKCDLCYESSNVKRHLIISISEQVYLSVPNYQSLTEGHCLIVPKRHVPSFLQLEEDEWCEVEDLKKSLRLMFKTTCDKSVIFLETSMQFYRFPHAVLECIPVPDEDAGMAPMYFKKGIDESEAEWANNIKLITLKKGLRSSVPKNLPYFCVLFDPEIHSGYAHVIEDEKIFPRNFGKEIVGGMLDINYNMLYKNKREDPVKKSNEALEFTKMWKKFNNQTS